MTDEQWLWLLVNQSIDAEEELDGLCDECRSEVTSDEKRCTRCGKPIGKHSEKWINPNFDREKFEQLSKDDDDIIKRVD